ncbi:MAG: polyphosphate:AMP phosphotransferase, partial [Mailhella sp.]|nr:polyphosphate:AMP phosphotransferase [Mailhella sp.]
GRFLDTASKAITLTDRAKAPWTIIDAADERYRNLTVVRTILHAVDQALAEQDAKKARVAAEKESGIRPAENVISTLDAIDLSVKADPESAGREIASLQKELRDLTFQAWKKGISTTLLFEGWDAAGKGGAIRRVLSGIDSRLCSVVPISAPTQEELAHHYLWRFWRHMPRAGFVTIFDRTWYGRVLVERLEKITPMEDWSRAYSEINVFEEDLTSTGNVLLKFWLHISPEEQLRRFKERERIPYKQYKITPEDWRNRDKWGDYVAAADEMFLRTNTDYAPWHIVPAEDKKYARIFVLRTYRDALKAALKARRKK